MPDIFVLLTANGKVSPEIVLLLLFLPIIATLVVCTRQIIGIKMFGAFAPIVATYAFLGTGIIPGIIIATLVFLISLLLRNATKSLRFHYLPRTSLLISLVSILLLILIPLMAYIPFFSITTLSAISVVLFVALSDIYLTSEIKEGYRKATKLYLETLVVSGVISILLSFTGIKLFLINYPEVIIIFLLINVYMGRWTGLRIMEIYRFRSIIKEKAKGL